MDGVIAVTDVNKNDSKSIASYDLMAHRIAFLPGSSSVFFSSHQDGRVRYFDLREKTTTHNVVIKLKNDRYWIPKACYNFIRDLISANGMAFAPYSSDPTKFALGGQDHLVRLYDIRQVFPIKMKTNFIDIQKYE
jgi:WD40 repeat protein